TYHLTSGSPAIGLGTNLTSLGIATLNRDKTGYARPATGGWDVGAYEFGGAAPRAPVITSATGATGTVGQAFSYQITATNSPTSYNATGLPAGLSVNTNTGLISGTPTAAAGTSSVTLSAANLGGTGTATLTLTINNASTGHVFYIDWVSGSDFNIGTSTSTPWKR